MDVKYGVIAVVCICIVILLIGACKQRMAFLLGFILRVVIGFVGIYLLNALFAKQGLGVAVGMNIISGLTLGTLGISGFFLLYGILLIQLL